MHTMLLFYLYSLLSYYTNNDNNARPDGRYYSANLVTIVLFLEGLMNGMPSRNDHSGVCVVPTSAGK